MRCSHRNGPTIIFQIIGLYTVLFFVVVGFGGSKVSFAEDVPSPHVESAQLNKSIHANHLVAHQNSHSGGHRWKESLSQAQGWTQDYTQSQVMNTFALGILLLFVPAVFTWGIGSRFFKKQSENFCRLGKDFAAEGINFVGRHAFLSGFEFFMSLAQKNKHSLCIIVVTLQGREMQEYSDDASVSQSLTLLLERLMQLSQIDQISQIDCSRFALLLGVTSGLKDCQDFLVELAVVLEEPCRIEGKVVKLSLDYDMKVFPDTLPSAQEMHIYCAKLTGMY